MLLLASNCLLKQCKHQRRELADIGRGGDSVDKIPGALAQRPACNVILKMIWGLDVKRSLQEKFVRGPIVAVNSLVDLHEIPAPPSLQEAILLTM